MSRDARTGRPRPCPRRAVPRRRRAPVAARPLRAPAPPAARPRRRPAARPARRPRGAGPADGLVVGRGAPWPALTGACWCSPPSSASRRSSRPTSSSAARSSPPSAGSAARWSRCSCPLANLAVGVVLVRGVVPKFGLAYAGVAGALAIGQLLIELYRGSSSTTRPGVEVIAGERVLTSSVDVGAGLGARGRRARRWPSLAGVCAVVAWGRTVMEDGGALDPVRSGLAGAAVLLGVAHRAVPGAARGRRARPAGHRPGDRPGDGGDPRGSAGAARTAGPGAARRPAARRRGRALLGRRPVAAPAAGRRGRPARDRRRRARRRR